MKKHDKRFRKFLKSELPKGSFLARSGRVTVVTVPTCRGRGWFSVSICSPDEVFKRKAGELAALQRWDVGMWLPMENPPRDQLDANMFAENMAIQLTGEW